MIEMNPRVSRSSALASKATGFPIAKIAARLAVGYRLDEIDNDITGVTPACFEPTIDYVVVKWPRFAFEKFPGADPTLTTHMKSVGEAMAIGRTFCQAFAKALRSRELDKPPCLDGGLRGGPARGLEDAGPERYEAILELLGRGAEIEAIHAVTAIDPWFLRELQTLALDPQSAVCGRALVPVGRHLRGRVPGAHALLLLRLGADRSPPSRRGAPRRARVGRDPRLGAEPDRAGDRVRLLLRARGDDRARVRPRRGDGQLQPGDRLDRLRHLRPPVLRAAHARGRARGRRGREAEGRDRAVRRADAAEARRRAGRGGRAAAGHERRCDRPGRGPRALRRAARAPGLQAPPYATARSVEEALAEDRARSASRCSCAPPTCSAGGRWRSSTRARVCRLPASRGAPRSRTRCAGDCRRFLLPILSEHLPRPLPRERDRGRRRRALRRGGRVDRRDHAARRGGRRALGRQRLRAAAALARRGDARADPRAPRARSRWRSGSSGCSTSSTPSTPGSCS